MGIGQVILGVRDLDAATARFERLGFEVVDGGVHPGLGTANRLIPLGSTYLELLGAVYPGEAAESDYGRSLLDRTAGGDCLVRWSIRTEHIGDVGDRLGLTPERRRRMRPDGSMLSWQAAGLELSLQDPWLPFFMRWDDPTQFPGAIPVAHPLGVCALSWLQISTPDRDRLARWIEGAGDLPLRVGEGNGIDAVAISTPNGELVITG